MFQFRGAGKFLGCPEAQFPEILKSGVSEMLFSVLAREFAGALKVALISNT